jgi:hypothetical protein
VPRCTICGNDFRDTGYQVLVPELGQTFDRIDCALEARRRSSPARPQLVESLMEEIARLRAELARSGEKPT